MREPDVGSNKGRKSDASHSRALSHISAKNGSRSTNNPRAPPATVKNTAREIPRRNSRDNPLGSLSYQFSIRIFIHYSFILAIDSRFTNSSSCCNVESTKHFDRDLERKVTVRYWHLRDFRSQYADNRTIRDSKVGREERKRERTEKEHDDTMTK